MLWGRPMLNINEVFYSIQGEGVRSGIPHVFIRFADCNLRCVKEKEGFDCDTEFTSFRELTIEQLIAEVESTYPDNIKPGDPRWVCLTGGEPALQVTEKLLEELSLAGFKVAIETNGTVPIPHAMIDWVTCSPKTAEHTLRIGSCDELKYVRAHGQAIPMTMAVTAEHYILSPAAEADGIPVENIQWCVDAVKNFPKWRLSIQLHKLLGVR